MFVPSTLFEELGFHYTGPIDGHDIPLLVSTMRTLKELKGPQLLHVITTKGKGYPPAEREQIEYHAVGPFDPRSRHRQEGRRRQAELHRDLRRLALRHGRCRCASVRHHAGDARRFRPGALLARVSGALFRRRHRRAARGDARGRHGLRRRKTRRRDLLDVPAARVRSADPRRRAAESRRAVRDRSRWARRARRSDPRGQLRSCVPALHPEHARDGAGRRGRVPQAADDRFPPRRPGGGALSARRRHRRRGAEGIDDASDRQGRSAPARTRHRAPRVRRDGGSVHARRRCARRDAHQHALRQAAGRSAAAGSRAVARGLRHRRGQCDRRRCRQRCRGAASQRTVLRSRFCTSGSPTAFSIMAAARNCSRRLGSTRRRSNARSARASMRSRRHRACAASAERTKKSPRP